MNAKKWNKMNIQNGFWIDGEQKNFVTRATQSGMTSWNEF